MGTLQSWTVLLASSQFQVVEAAECRVEQGHLVMTNGGNLVRAFAPATWFQVALGDSDRVQADLTNGRNN